jgi:uncharacterized protein YdbL (DUF1318 family)
MNTTRHLVAASAIALLATGTAFAQEATPDTWTTVHGSQSRAAVVADLATARQAGLPGIWTEGYIEPVRTSAVQRADVRQQTLLAIRSGEMRAINAEVASVPLAAVQAMRSAG